MLAGFNIENFYYTFFFGDVEQRWVPRSEFEPHRLVEIIRNRLLPNGVFRRERCRYRINRLLLVVEDVNARRSRKQQRRLVVHIDDRDHECLGCLCQVIVNNFDGDEDAVYARAHFYLAVLGDVVQPGGCCAGGDSVFDGCRARQIAGASDGHKDCAGGLAELRIGFEEH